MSISSGLKTTLNIVNAAGLILDPKNPLDAQAIKQVESVANKVGRAGQYANRLDRAGSAITSFSAQTTILSRAFVDDSILDEPILPNLFRSFHEWYAAQIISALHLSRMVDSHRTVQDVMSVVQTGHNQRERGLLGNLTARKLGMESFLSNYTGEAALESHDPQDPFVLMTKQEIDDLQKERDGYKRTIDQRSEEDRKKKIIPDQMSVRSVNVSENRIGPMGELYEVKLTNPEDKNRSITVPVFVQMQPSIVSSEVAPRFIDMNVAPTYWQRLTQMRAGELTFWKDFCLNHDLIKRQKSIIKDSSRADAFSEFLKTVAKKDKYAIDDVSDRLGSRQSSNLANSVMVFSEDTVAQAKVDSGIDLHNDRDRARYFRDTYTMIIAVIDPLHQRVTVYFNGLDGDINVSYNDFRPKDTKFDPKEFMTALQAFSSGNIGRLR